MTEPELAPVLIIDDEPDIRGLLEITLGRMGLSTHAVETLAEARAALQEQSFSLCLTDMNLPDGKGLELVEEIQKHHAELPVAVITAYGSMELAIASLKAGAFDFVSKPVQLSRLRELVNSALRLNSGETPPAIQSSSLLGATPCMQQLREQIAKVARSQAPIYISGESGSGKEVVARNIHRLGPREKQPFIAVNCGAIPAELVESEFFGHRKGAFTGATQNKIGLFQAAQGGTLFLDEVADLPLPIQVKLLRAIQEKAVRPVGSQEEIPVDVRILSATHKNLAAMVEAGSFRQDLFYRINVIELRVPPLRERVADIPLLAERILTRNADETESAPYRIAEDALARLCAYAFPGNVRELENILERACTLCENRTIQMTDIILQDAPARQAEHTPSEGASEEVAEMDIEPARPGQNLEDYLESVERQAIEKALEDNRWNRTAAAKQLGITFRALRYRLKKLGLE